MNRRQIETAPLAQLKDRRDELEAIDEITELADRELGDILDEIEQREYTDERAQQGTGNYWEG